MEPLFSVIVPIYGVEKYIDKCIGSILNQTFTDYELILVDDGSLDRCPQICDEYAKTDDRIKVIHKANGGLVSARKAGCKVASGKYIVNVDGDDWIRDGYFDAIAQIAEQYEPEVICFGTIYHWGNREEEVSCQYTSKYYSREEIENEIFPVLIEAETGEYFPPSIWSKAVRRDLYRTCQDKVDDRIVIGEDVACTRQIIYWAKNMYVMNDCLYYYRQNDQSMTKSKKAFSMRSPELISHILMELASNNVQMELQVYRCVCHLFFIAALTQFNRQEHYRKIVGDIEMELEKEYIQTAIQKCYYKPLYYKGRIALFCLRHKLFYAMKLLNFTRK
ncbi:hypothetical protein B5F12_00450 [Pseudoflavonifractor sp. An176]|uniref:glycosyltransferase family 2 protein n=1 Tax=Pseudoflavonifractor sp. An176 TaxID=1965572 RepID=UPI000B37837D|nr:glycosyltransferase family 2 protein [Pseudoflavonifractor sp. An176]OUP66029.1 hypothetical protein B5F12_00450 [Pseudoflavonifractor sp. An176]